MAAGTIIATNYVGMARVLRSSFERQHPGHPFFTLLIDGDESQRALTGVGEVLLPTDLSIPAEEWLAMAAGYSVMELATAAKPGFLQCLLDGAETATYLDPDIKVYQPLTETFEAAARSSIALTPHCLSPVPRDGLELSERTLMLAGLFNLGFISVGQRSRQFLRWWHERLRHDAIVDVENGLFTDQRWVDWVPTLFEHAVLRDPGLNVAYWNAHERDVRQTSSGFYAGTSPLKFFHFSGYDPAVPWLLSKHAVTRPRVRLNEQPAIEELCADYASDLEHTDHAGFQRLSYRLDLLPNGFRMTPRVRRVVRTAYLTESDQRRSIRNPYSDPAGFVDWLCEPVRGTIVSPLSRWDCAIWQDRPDLQAAFPDIDAGQAADFRRWLDNDPDALEERVQAFGRRAAERPRSATRRPSSIGWSVIAYASAELGVGEAGRRLAKAAGQIGLPTEIVGVSEAGSRQQHQHNLDVRATPSFDNSVTCVNADRLERTWQKVGIGDTERRGSRIGLFFWEVDQVPERYLPAFCRLDQIWVASEYTRRVFDRLGLCSVELIRLPVMPRSAPTPYTRSLLGLPEDKFLFFCSYDFFSVVKRKNPLDVIEAYTSAFGPDDGAALVLKSINGHQRGVDLAMVQRAAQRRPDIHVLDGYRTAGQIAGMIELSDCVVSLHRSEGYGLNLADAMAVGTPVLATAYSGNMTFMDEQSAFLVPFEEIVVGPGSEPYPAQAHWAQPDLQAGARIMRGIFDNPDEARGRGRAGRCKILRENSLEVAGARLRELTLRQLQSS